MSGPGLKTYSHLAAARRIPSEYEVVTTRLLYYVANGGFEVNLPLGAWYRRYQTDSPLRCSPAGWECFRDPRETTYTAYTASRKRQEEHLDALMQPLDDPAHDRRFPARWRAFLDRVLTPQRFLFHGFQMLAAYLGHMAPEGRVVIVAALQAADEMRRVQRIAYRMAQLRNADPAFGAGSGQTWQVDPSWQPVRRVVERALVTYDWGEALVLLNVCLKPALDHLFGVELARVAGERGDFVLDKMLTSFAADCAWHRSWTAALLRVACQENPENRAPIERWVGHWQPLVREAIAAAAGMFAAEAGAQREGERAASAATEAAASFGRGVLGGEA